MNIRCPLCDWTYSLPDLPPVNESTLAGVFGPGVMLNQALNNRMFKTEEELRNHFGTHKLADWAAKVTQLENELREEREESEHMNRLIHRQGELLTSAVNILHGGQMENGFWSHHDIAELTQQVMDRNRDLEIRLAACEALRQHLEANLRISE